MWKNSQGILNRRRMRSLLSLTLAGVTGMILFLGGGTITEFVSLELINSKPAISQSLRAQDVWQEVYQRLPKLPLENQYISKATGEVAEDETLVSRLIRYHLYVKNRPPYYRFDWKLTLGDYLGVNDYLVESEYPGGSTLQQNPMEGDRAAMQKLTRRERDALVGVLVSIFAPTRPETSVPTPRESPSPSPTPTPRNIPRLPQPGDAQLLKP